MHTIMIYALPSGTNERSSAVEGRSMYYVRAFDILHDAEVRCN